MRNPNNVIPSQECKSCLVSRRAWLQKPFIHPQIARLWLQQTGIIARPAHQACSNTELSIKEVVLLFSGGL